jgi:hypothetical protein
MNTAPMAINEHVFIRRIFLEVSPDLVASVSNNAFESSKNFRWHAIYFLEHCRTQMLRDRAVNNREDPLPRAHPNAGTDVDAAENGPLEAFDFESKPEKRDAPTAPASKFYYEIETL